MDTFFLIRAEIYRFHLGLRRASGCRRREFVIIILVDEGCGGGIITVRRIAPTSDDRHRAEDISPDTGEFRGKPCAHGVSYHTDIVTVDTETISHITDDGIDESNIFFARPSK